MLCVCFLIQHSFFSWGFLQPVPKPAPTLCGQVAVGPFEAPLKKARKGWLVFLLPLSMISTMFFVDEILRMPKRRGQVYLAKYGSTSDDESRGADLFGTHVLS